MFAVARRENWNAGTLEQQVPPPHRRLMFASFQQRRNERKKKKRKQKREPKKPQTRKSNDSVAVLGFHGPGPFDEPVGCDHRQPLSLSLSLSLSLLLFDDRRHRRLKNEAKKKPKKCWPSCPTTPVSSDKDRGNNNKKNKLKSKIEIRFLEGEFVTEKVSLLVYTCRNRKRVGRSFLFFLGRSFFFLNFHWIRYSDTRNPSKGLRWIRIGNTRMSFVSIDSSDEHFYFLKMGEHLIEKWKKKKKILRYGG